MKIMIKIKPKIKKSKKKNNKIKKFFNKKKQYLIYLKYKRIFKK